MVVVEVKGYTIEPRANLNGVDLEGANFIGTNLGGANLSEAQLWGANLEGANIGEPKANEDTIWPEGFDPIAAGVTFD